MPASHTIDHKNRLIETRWIGEPGDEDLVKALTKYLREIRSRSEFATYNELVNFSNLAGTRISKDGLQMLIASAEKYDRPGIRSKLAFVAGTNLTYGLTRMYAIYRSFSPKSTKQIQVFKTRSAAMAWLTGRQGSVD